MVLMLDGTPTPTHIAAYRDFLERRLVVKAERVKFCERMYEGSKASLDRDAEELELARADHQQLVDALVAWDMAGEPPPGLIGDPPSPPTGTTLEGIDRMLVPVDQQRGELADAFKVRMPRFEWAETSDRGRIWSLRRAAVAVDKTPWGADVLQGLLLAHGLMMTSYTREQAVEFIDDVNGNIDPIGDTRSMFYTEGGERRPIESLAELHRAAIESVERERGPHPSWISLTGDYHHGR